VVARAVVPGLVFAPWLAVRATDVLNAWVSSLAVRVEHYGLRRQKLPKGCYERVRASHSWMVLSHAEEAPQPPSGYGSMAPLALIPPLWRRILDQRVLDHHGGDIQLAALSPRRDKRLLQWYQPPRDRQVA
jgi:alkane 1-monooxygenase